MQTIVVTGASQGIGAAVCKAFAAIPETRVALLARNEEKMAAVASSCEKLGAETMVLPCDVVDADRVQEAASRVLSKWGTPDVLVNNAGLFEPGSLLETSIEAFRRQIDVNLISAYLVTRAFLASMVERGRGTLFFMASVASIRAYPAGAAYCTAKHGLLGLARSVREETREAGIRVTALLPGATLTPSWDGVDLPAERFMPAEDIARTLVEIYTLSDRTVVEELILRPQLGDL